MTSDGDITWKWWSMVIAWSMKGYTWHRPVLALSLLAVGVRYYSSVPYYCNQTSYTQVVQCASQEVKWPKKFFYFVIGIGKLGNLKVWKKAKSFLKGWKIRFFTTMFCPSFDLSKFDLKLYVLSGSW